MRRTNKRRSGKPGAAKREISRRDLRRVVGELLEAVDFTASLYGLQQLPRAKAINALFGYLSDSRDSVRTRAAQALGELVALLIEDGNTVSYTEQNGFK